MWALCQNQRLVGCVGIVDREKPVLGDYPLNVMVIQNQRRDLVGSGFRKISLAGGWSQVGGLFKRYLRGENVDPGCYELKVWVPKTPDSYAEA